MKINKEMQRFVQECVAKDPAMFKDLKNSKSLDELAEKVCKYGEKQNFHFTKQEVKEAVQQKFHSADLSNEELRKVLGGIEISQAGADAWKIAGDITEA